MGVAVVTVASGGMPVVDVTSIAPRTGLPVTEASNGRGLRITKVAKFGIPVVFETIGVAPPLVPPTYVNVGAQTSATAAALSLTLPGSRVNGNLLIAFIGVNSPTSAGITWPGGWTPIDVNGGSGSPLAGWAYRYVDGSETNPSVSWTGSATCRGGIMQLSGTRSSSPIGHTTKNFQVSTTTITCPELVPVSNNSLAFGIQHTGNSGVPAGWTGRFDIATSGVRQQGWSKALAAAGVGSGAISVATGAVTNITTMLAEIKAAGAP